METRAKGRMKYVPQICALGIPRLAAWKETRVSLQSSALPPELSRALDKKEGPPRAAPAPQRGQGAVTSLQSIRAGDLHRGAPGLTPQLVSLCDAWDATLVWTAATDKTKWIKPRMSGSEVWLHCRFVLWPWFTPERVCFLSFPRQEVRWLW